MTDSQHQSAPLRIACELGARVAQPKPLMDATPSPATDSHTREKRESRLGGDQDVQYEQLRADVEVRLRRVCADLPPQHFDELVRDICTMKLRWADDTTRRL